MLRHIGRTAIAVPIAAVIVLATCPMSAQAVDFKGKTIDMIIGNPPGGGTDASGRLVASFLEKYLPGNPSVVIRNMPGAQGVSALNHVFLQTKRDGLTVMLGSNSQVNPLAYRKANAQYDPSKFHYVGGLGRGGTALVASVEALKRLNDPAAKPVNYGVIDATRPSQQVGLWGVELLGWNVKWVSGYRGANDTSLALERREIDMTATGNLFLLKRLVDSGQYKLVNQSGSLEDGKYVARPEFGDAPVFRDLVFDKLKTPLARQAFEYWESSVAIDKWFALSAGTPDDIVNAYRAAFEKMVKDPEFSERGKKISEDLEAMGWRDMQTLANKMVSVTQETEDYITSLLKKQGATVGER